MIYPFMTLEDNTEITHSEMQANGEVKVYVETPDEKVEGYSEEVEKYPDFIHRAAHIIFEFSQEGGFNHAKAV